MLSILSYLFAGTLFGLGLILSGMVNPNKVIGFLDITRIVGQCLDQHLADGHVADEGLTLEAVLAADAWGRTRAAEIAGATA